MTHDDVQAWLDAYVAAWRSYEPEAIADLFSEDATYAINPWAEPITGRDAIVASWTANPDPPDSWDAAYRPLLISGDQVVATGETSYTGDDTYVNLWLLSFDDQGRCASYVDWYMIKPS